MLDAFAIAHVEADDRGLDPLYGPHYGCAARLSNGRVGMAQSQCQQSERANKAQDCTSKNESSQ